MAENDRYRLFTEGEMFYMPPGYSDTSLQAQTMGVIDSLDLLPLIDMFSLTSKNPQPPRRTGEGMSPRRLLIGAGIALILLNLWKPGSVF